MFMYTCKMCLRDDSAVKSAMYIKIINSFVKPIIICVVYMENAVLSDDFLILTLTFI